MSGWMDPKKCEVKLNDNTFLYLNKSITIFFESIRGIYYHRALNEFIKKQLASWHEDHIIYQAHV